jgi:hypothetical protein
MTSPLTALIESVQAAIDLLVAHGDDSIAPRLVSDVERLRTGDPAAAQSVLSEATGGAGSLNDRILSRRNGDRIEVSAEEAVNDQLDQIINRVRKDARAALAVKAAP